jgi:hypothetical protein
VRQLTTDGAHYRDVSWSPVGDLIAATRCPIVSAEPRCLHQEQPILLAPATGDLEAIEFAPIAADAIAGRPVVWSPDGSGLLLYLERRAPGASSSLYGYVLLDLTTRQVEPLNLTGTVAAWDASSGRLLMVRPQDGEGLALGWHDLETDEFEVELAYTEQESLLGPYALSPNGGTLLRSDSAEPSLCLDLETYRLSSHTSFEPYLSQACFPSWSPDGTRLVFAEKDSPTSDPSRLVIVNADGSNPVSLLGETRISGLSFPAWSPDGSHIAFTRTGLGNTSAIYIVEVPPGMLP